MTTRGQTVRNENTAPTQVGQKAAAGGAGGAAQVTKLLKPRTRAGARGVRQALGDISNRIKASAGIRGVEDGAIKKKMRSDGAGAQVMEIQEEVEVDSAVRSQPVSMVEEKTAVEAGPDASSSGASRMSIDGAGDMVVMDAGLEEDMAGVRLYDDVDAPYKNDPRRVTEYIGDIMSYFRAVESRRLPSAGYMSKQTDINAKMREILIDWLVEVHLKFKLRQETLYLTVNLIDRFLERRAVKRTKLQLVGCTAMLLASKYEEIYAPEVRDFVYISDKAYTHDQILAMEGIMLNTLKFNMTVPSSLRFVQRFCAVSGDDQRLQMLTSYILESHLQKYQFLVFKPSLIAASATFLALMSLNGKWDAKMLDHTKYTEQQLMPCVNELLQVLLARNSRYNAVKKKYSHTKFLQVAKLKLYTPPDFVLVDKA